MAEKKITGEAELTFLEATSIIVGHGVGSGILIFQILVVLSSLLATVGAVLPVK